MAQTVAFSPFSDDVMTDPYPHYARLRADEPLARVDEFVAVSRYADVLALVRDHGHFTSTRGNTRDDMPQVADTTMITSDPPRHTALRQLVNRAFTPRMVAALEPRVRELACHLLHDALERRGDRLELVGDLAHPLPVTIIAEIMGVDRDRRADFRRWSDDAIAALGGGGYGEASRMVDSLTEFTAYFGELIDERRRAPRDDLVSSLLVKAEETPQPGQLVTLCFLLLVAGHETTTNAIGNGTLALLENPAELARLREDPDLVPSYVEEALRYDAPVQGLYRTTTCDTEIAGVRVAEGTKVLALFASANRDEAQFPQPDRFDVGRRPNLHLAFGSGVHFCLGSSLARLELRVVTEELLRLRHLALDEADPPERRLNPTVRGLHRLPVVVDP